MNLNRLNRIFGQVPRHIAVIGLMLIWIIPTVGLFITSIRPAQDVSSSGWWTVFSPRPAAGEE